MKNSEQIAERVRYLLREELEARLRESQEPLPVRCKYNLRQPLDYRKTIEGNPNPNYNRVSLPVEDSPTLGLCMYNSKASGWDGTICEDPIDAQDCCYKAFTPKQTPQEVYDQFLKDLEDNDWVIEHLPRIQPLLWVLGAKYEHSDEAPQEQPPPKPLGFFERLKQVFWPTSPQLPQLPPAGPSATLKVYLPPPP